MMDYFNQPAPQRLSPWERILEQAERAAKQFEIEQQLARLAAQDTQAPLREWLWQQGRIDDPFLPE